MLKVSGTNTSPKENKPIQVDDSHAEITFHLRMESSDFFFIGYLKRFNYFLYVG